MKTVIEDWIINLIILALAIGSCWLIAWALIWTWRGIVWCAKEVWEWLTCCLHSLS